MNKDDKASSAQELISSRLAGPWILPHHGIQPGDTIASAVHAELLRNYAKLHPGNEAAARVATIEHELHSGYVAYLSAVGYSDASHSADTEKSAVIPPSIADSESLQARSLVAAVEELASLRGHFAKGSPDWDAASALRILAFFALGRDTDAVSDAKASAVLISEPSHEHGAASRLHAAHLVMAASLIGLAAERGGAPDLALDAYEHAASLYKSQKHDSVGIDELERWAEIALYRSALLNVRLGRDASGALRRYQAAEARWPSIFRTYQRTAVSAAYLNSLNKSFAKVVSSAAPTSAPSAIEGLTIRTACGRRGRPFVIPRSTTNELAKAKAAVLRSLESGETLPRAGETNAAAERMADEIVLAWQHDGAQGGAVADEVAFILYRIAKITFRSQRVLRHLVEVLTAAEAYAEAIAALDQYIALVERVWGTSGLPNDQGLADGRPVDTPAEFVDTLLRGAHVALVYLNDHATAERLSRMLLRLVGREASDGIVVEPPRPVLAQVLRAAARVTIAKALDTPGPARRTQLIAACEQLQESAALDPDASETHFALAGVKAQLRDTRGALIAGRRALELEPASLDTWHLLVLLLSAEKDFSGALALADEALSQADADDAADAQGASARAYLASYDYPPSARERAESYVQLMITHNVLTELTEGSAAALEEQKEIFEAFQSRLVTRATPAAAVPAATVSPGDVAPTPAAARVARRVSRETRTLVDLWLLSSATFRRAGDLEQARSAINEAERLDAGNASVWVQLAQWCNASELHGAAVTCLYKALACDGESVAARVLLSRHFLEPNALALRQSHADAIAAAAAMDSTSVMQGKLFAPGAAARRAGARALGATTQPRLGSVAAEFSWDTSPHPAAASLAEVLLRTTTQHRGWDSPEAWHLLARIERGRSGPAERTALVEALSLEESRPIRVIRDAIAFP
ncbi:hypothetical protein MCUN1_003470 [Malassezia cuniculi]|uniref:Tetratricopeptide repeat protein n=1 Tax=Malassezia cuniculi TaxID=948313 RepID=A0AAF0EXM6_9BASI|nr:hypothetical protein MCUN1_003470 [Malassezia cuniculi]